MAIEEGLSPDNTSDSLHSESGISAVLRRLADVEQELFNVNIRLRLAEIFLGGKILNVQTIGPSFQSTEGFSWIFELPGLSDLASSVSAPHQSSLVVCEDGKPLGPGNAIHDDIRKIGLGLYSHWSNYLIFSTSDNSNPNHNGRRYDIVFPQDE